MAAYRLTQTADARLSGIYEYSHLTFGEAQADAYLIDLHRIFELLAETPFMGRDCSELGTGLRRILHRRHVAFYRIMPEGVLIVYIIGADQLPEKHLRPDQ
ncbi:MULTISPECIES: type II toxin-antitoxin system RelE/ParE family toxin [unclassified Rhizobium]|uniref:type II toxin-antitoxin system RelE/ParE family toxin n=1 Tax=unclassified Rhizobium TaxID=2613769 RepID=UPI00104CDDDF|nr:MULTISPECIES: type II toxin-antitoxin system RelE/ParE family toxin [unclassified Rhizobium]TCS05037.1 toxin ParE1/3/4 [Rhizobium sp. BK418]